MNSKFLIIQIDIGEGTQWGENNTIDPIREIFIPSVKSYCTKKNYLNLTVQNIIMTMF